jgi:hypothetical protein
VQRERVTRVRHQKVRSSAYPLTSRPLTLQWTNGRITHILIVVSAGLLSRPYSPVLFGQVLAMSGQRPDTWQKGTCRMRPTSSCAATACVLRPQRTCDQCGRAFCDMHARWRSYAAGGGQHWNETVAFVCYECMPPTISERAPRTQAPISKQTLRGGPVIRVAKFFSGHPSLSPALCGTSLTYP